MVTRQVAGKVWLQQLWSHDFVEQSGEWDPNYVLVGSSKISRVNVVASVVDIYQNVEKLFSSVTLDDGSSTMRVKAFKNDVKLINHLKVGDIVNVVGRVRKFNDELFIAPEVVRVVGPQWELLRRVGLLVAVGPFVRSLPLRDLYQEVKDP